MSWGCRIIVVRQTNSGSWEGVEYAGWTRRIRLQGEDAGRSEGDLCAVGWHGEIVTVADGTASRAAAPTNVILTNLCTGPGQDYSCCSQRGILLRGRGDQCRCY